MASKSERLRLAYEYKLGKDLASKLSDRQIKKLSEYYNSLPPKEQTKVDSEIIKGGGEFLDIARGMAGDKFVELNDNEKKKYTPSAKAPEQGPMRPPRNKGGDVYSPRASDSEIASGLAVIPKVDTKEEEKTLVGENIDERILSILGLDDAIDIDYATYKTLLREKMAAARMTNAKIPTEEIELITNEFKRVKRNSGRFKVKKKKVNINKVVSDKQPQKLQLDPKKLLPSSVEASEKIKDLVSDEKDDESKEVKKFIKKDLLESIKNINSTLQEILSLMKTESDVRKKSQEKDRIAEQKGKKRVREEKLESGAEKSQKKMIDKVAKPFVSLFDTIKRFLLNVLFGTAAVWLMDIIKNPRKLLIPIQKLINGIFDFFNGFVKWVDNNLIQPIRNFIDSINDGIEGFVTQLNKILQFIPNSSPIDAPKIPNIPDVPVFEPPNIVGPDITVMRNGGMVLSPKITVKKYNNGGHFPGGIVDKNTGTTVSGLGQDTQLTALRKGEFVLVPGAAQEIGIDNLMAANKKHGGTNIPQNANVNNMKVRKMAGGGPVDPFPGGSYKAGPGQKYGDPRDYGGHAGIDITEDPPWKADPKRPIYAIKSGKVLSERYQRSGYTSGLMVDHGDGFQSRYLHMTPFLRPGDTVRAGQQVGKLLDLGDQTHLHLEYYKGSRRLNPVALIRGTTGGQYTASEDRGTTSDSPSFGETLSPPPEIHFADIRGASNKKLVPGTPVTRTPKVVPLPITPSGSTADAKVSGSTTGESGQISKFSSVDFTNPGIVATSSIFQIGGN